MVGEGRFGVVPTKEEVIEFWERELAPREDIQRWISKSFKNGRIPTSNKLGLALFLKATGMTLEELIELHRQWVLNPREQCPTADLMDEYAKYLLEKIKYAAEQGWKGRKGGEVPQSTLSGMHTGVRSFISFYFGKRNGIPCQNIPDYNVVSEGNKTYHPPLSVIRELCEVSDIVGRWIIIASFQMPARIGDLAKLRYTEDIERQVNEILEGVDEVKSRLKAVIIHYTPEKGNRVGGRSAGERVLCFFGDAFDIFLQYREKVNLQVGDYLFKGYPGKVKTGVHRDEMIRRYFDNAAKLIKLQERVKGRRVRFHGLRGAGIQAWNHFDKMMGDYMSGHIIPGVGENYYSERDLYDACEKLYYELNPYAARDRHLKSFEETVKETSAEVERLKAELAALRQENMELRRMIAQNPAEAFQAAINGNDEIQQLKRENQELKEQLAELTRLVQSLIEGKATKVVATH